MASSLCSGTFKINDTKTGNSKAFGDSGQNDPFRATQLWYKVIAYLRSHVQLKKRRYMIRQYNDCFTGENAVDVVFVCLLNEQPNCSLLTNEITRASAVKVCQVLMENDIFEDVGKRSADASKKCAFEDSGTKFYQFSLRGKQMEIYSPRHKPLLPSPTNRTDDKLRTISLNSELRVPPLFSSDPKKKLCKSAENLESSDPTKKLCKSAENLENYSPNRGSITPINDTSPDSNIQACLSPFQRLRSLSISNASSSHSSSWSPAPGGAASVATVATFQPSSFRTSIRRRLMDFQNHVNGGGGVAITLGAEGGGDGPVSGDDSSGNGQTFDVSDAKSGRPNLLRFRKRMSSSGSNLTHISVPEEEVPVSSVDEDGIWMQVALSRLLTLIDLSFLDELLPHLHGTRPADSTSTISHGQSPLCRSPLRDDTNAWVRMSEEITESRCFFLDNPIGLSEDELKLQALRKVRRYYRSLPQLPIVPAHLNKVFIAVLGLIRAAKFTAAVHTLRLTVLLLPWQQRKELRLLFRFVRLVADDDARLRLKPQMSNLHVMLQQFVPMIIRYELLAAEQAGLLVSFMLQHHELIFVAPADIKSEVESIILEAKLNNTTPISASISYCQQVTPKVYEEQKSSMTQRALTDLMNSVLDSTALPLKDKELWLKKFKKSHPDFYDKWYHGEI